jgi:hypothetical protein
MTHPRDAKGRFVRRTAAAACHLPRQARRAAGQLAAAATRLRQTLNGGHVNPYRRSSTILRIVTLMSPSSSPVPHTGEDDKDIRITIRQIVKSKE